MPNKPIGGGYLRYPRTGIINNRRRGSQHLNVRNHRVSMGNNTIVGRTISRNMYVGKVHKNRKQRRTKEKKLSVGNSSEEKVDSQEVADETANADENVVEDAHITSKEFSPEGLSNG